jgi:peptidoglycan/LPS O-acetylase OafA/YrhL
MLFGLVPKIWFGVVGAALMIRNFLPLSPVYWETNHFWSLSVEEHFYLLLPGFLVLVKRYRLSTMVMLALLFEFWRGYYLRMPRSPDVYFRTDIAVEVILLGCVFALALQRPHVRKFAARYLQPWKAFLYLAAVFVLNNLHHSRTEHLLSCTVYPVLIVATVMHSRSFTTRLLEAAPMRFIGRISYSLYLWQELFLDRFQQARPHTLRSHVFLCWCLTFAFALASYYLVEVPLIRRGHRIAKRFDMQLAGRAAT